MLKVALVLLSYNLPKISFTPGALATFFNQYKISGLPSLGDAVIY